jgi:hypothetical protein
MPAIVDDVIHPRRSPNLSKVPVEALLDELRSRDLVVATQPAGPGTVEVSTTELTGLLATVSEHVKNYVKLADDHVLLWRELASERALTARLLVVAGYDLSFTADDQLLLNGESPE